MKSEYIKDSIFTAESVQTDFQRWRETRTKREAVPEALWSAAVELTEQLSICQVAKLLKLNYSSLKQRVGDFSPSIHTPIKASPFIEIPSVRTNNVRHCHVDIKRSDGSQMQIELTQDSAAELSILVRAFLA